MPGHVRQQYAFLSLTCQELPHAIRSATYDTNCLRCVRHTDYLQARALSDARTHFTLPKFLPSARNAALLNG